MPLHKQRSAGGHRPISPGPQGGRERREYAGWLVFRIHLLGRPCTPLYSQQLWASLKRPPLCEAGNTIALTSDPHPHLPIGVKEVFFFGMGDGTVWRAGLPKVLQNVWGSVWGFPSRFSTCKAFCRTPQVSQHSRGVGGARTRLLRTSFFLRVCVIDFLVEGQFLRSQMPSKQVWSLRKRLDQKPCY